MRYSNYKNYNDPIKPYIHDSLEMLRILEYKQYQDIQLSYIEVIKPITNYIANQKGKFEGIDKLLDELIEKAKKNLDERLNFIIYDSLKRGVSIALSVSARLKVDEELYSQKKLNGEMHLIGEASRPTTKDKNLIVKKIQSDVSKKSEEIARHTMEKKRLYREKEFKLSSRVWDLSNGQGEKIKKLVEAGVNMDCKKLAKALDECAKMGNSKPIKEYPNMMKRLNGRFPPDTSFAAMRVARNELSELYFTTSIKDYMENPYVEAVQWLLANNRLKMYEDECDCNDIAYEDVYGLGRGIYPIDKVPDRPHVMCLCTIAPITSRKLKKQLEGGMKLGNVPTEEWLKKQEAQLKLDLLQDTSEQASTYSLSKFEWLNKTKEDEKVLLLEDFSCVNPFIIKRLNSCQNPLIAEIHYERNPHFNITENKIYYNAFIKDPRSIEAGFKTNMTGFLHEAGHFLDYNLSKDGKPLHTKMKDLDYYLKKDALDFVNGIYRKAIPKKQFIPFTTLEGVEFEKSMQFYKKLGDINGVDYSMLVTNELLKNKHTNSAVSDLLEGLTGGRLAGYNFDTYGHMQGNTSYWDSSKLILRKETIAHMFEAIGSENKRFQILKNVFPLTFVYFCKFL